MEEKKLVPLKEKILFLIIILISALIWALLFIFTFGVAFVILLIILFFSIFWYSSSIYKIRGNAVKVTSEQFSDIFLLKTDLEVKMLIYDKIDFYIRKEVKEPIIKKFFGRYIVVFPTSMIKSAMEDEDVLKFILAQQLAYIKRAYAYTNFFIKPALWIPWLGNYYLKLREYTCDQMALYYSKIPVKKGIKVLSLYSVGDFVDLINPKEYVKQVNDVQGFLGKFFEAKSKHAYISRRMLNLMKNFSDEKVKVKIPNFLGTLAANIFTFFTVFVLIASTGFYLGYKKIEPKISKLFGVDTKKVIANVDKTVNKTLEVKDKIVKKVLEKKKETTMDKFMKYYKRYKNYKTWSFGITFRNGKMEQQAQIERIVGNKVYVNYYDAFLGKDVRKIFATDEKRIKNFYIYSPKGYYDTEHGFEKLEKERKISKQ